MEIINSFSDTAHTTNPLQLNTCNSSQHITNLIPDYIPIPAKQASKIDDTNDKTEKAMPLPLLNEKRVNPFGDYEPLPLKKSKIEDINATKDKPIPLETWAKVTQEKVTIVKSFLKNAYSHYNFSFHISETEYLIDLLQDMIHIILKSDNKSELIKIAKREKEIMWDIKAECAANINWDSSANNDKNRQLLTLDTIYYRGRYVKPIFDRKYKKYNKEIAQYSLKLKHSKVNGDRYVRKNKQRATLTQLHFDLCCMAQNKITELSDTFEKLKVKSKRFGFKESLKGAQKAMDSLKEQNETLLKEIEALKEYTVVQSVCYLWQ